MSTQPIEFAGPSLLAVHRPAYLMCPPRHYDVNYVINPWMAGNLHASSLAQATEQWCRLHHALTQIADVELIAPQPGSPDMVFTANSGLQHNGTVVLSRFLYPERQAEEQYYRRWFVEAGYTIIDLPPGIPFEGEGDALFSIDSSRLWAGYGPRTSRESHSYLARAWNVEVISLHLVDPRFYHLDTCFAPLSGSYVMYYPGAFDAVSLTNIEACYSSEKRIVVSQGDAKRFACNVINVDRTIILNDISRELSAQLESAGFHVVPVTLTEFLKAGGAAKCLVMQLDSGRSEVVLPEQRSLANTVLR